jgi:hypothetical protein
MLRFFLGTVAAAVLAFAAPAFATDHLYGITNAVPPHFVGFESNNPNNFTIDDRAAQPPRDRVGERHGRGRHGD